MRRLAAELPDSATVHPTHGFGSFCSASATSGHDASTIAQEKQLNPALNQDEDQWVADVLAVAPAALLVAESAAGGPAPG